MAHFEEKHICWFKSCYNFADYKRGYCHSKSIFLAFKTRLLTGSMSKYWPMLHVSIMEASIFYGFTYVAHFEQKRVGSKPYNFAN